MHTRDSVGLAMGSLRQNKLRSLLTLLGVIIGIASVITIMTLGHSLQAQINGAIADSGGNDLTLEIEKKPDDSQDKKAKGPEGMGAMFDSEPIPDELQFTPEKVAELKERFAGILGDVRLQSGYFNGDIALNPDDPAEKTNVSILPVNPDYIRMSNINVGWGRSLSDADIEAERPVAVIHQDEAEKLFGSPEKALGERFEVTIKSETLELMVVGVIPKKADGLLKFDFNSGQVLIPYPLARSLSDRPLQWTQLSLRPAEGASKQELIMALNNYADHMFGPDSEYQGKLTDNAKAGDTFGKVLTGLSVGLAMIGGISLLVGGIGVMNIMLVTVTERTREIGIRKALGARNKDIRLQFVIEAMIICLIGGIIGVLLGGGLGMIGAKFMGKMVFPPLLSVVVSLLFSMSIGLFFGYYPASKAAKLNPIDALRHE